VSTQSIKKTFSSSLFFVLLSFLLIGPTTVSASSIIRTGSTVAISNDQVVEGDFYGFGETLTVSGDISEDLLLLGGEVKLNGTVGADTLIVAGNVDVFGTIADDVRVISGTVTIAGNIAGDLIVVAQELDILSSATIGGDVVFFGGTAEVAGVVGKDVIGTSERIRIDGEVAGGVDVSTGQLTLGERASISGDVVYASASELVRAQNASIGGDLIKGTVPAVPATPVRTLVIPFLVTLFAALVCFLLLRRPTTAIAEIAHRNHFRNLLIGFGLVFLTPFAATILIVSTLGSIVGVILLSAYLLGVFLTLVLVGIVLGSYFAKMISKTPTVSIPYIVIGVAVANLLFYIPFLGPLLLLGLFLNTFGALATSMYTNLRSN
jgi:cytoskeletal protein CcmA (bactofilin family)